MLTDDDIQRLRTALADDFRTIHGVTPEDHRAQHDWIAMLIKKDERRQEMRAKVLASATLWAVPILIVFALSAFGNELLRVLRQML